MEHSVLEMLSGRSSAPTLLGCRPSARKSIGRSQKRFQLLTKRGFCSLHHDNKHSFKANSLLNPSCPRRYVRRGPDTMIVIAGDPLSPTLDRIYSPVLWIQQRKCKSCICAEPSHSRAFYWAAAGRTQGFSSSLFRGFAPTEPAGGMAGLATGQPFCSAGCNTRFWPGRGSSSPRGTTT